MEYIKNIIYAIVPMGIIFLIIHNIIPSKNNARRSFWLFIAFIGFLMFFGAGIIYDYYNRDHTVFSHYEYYLPLTIISVAYLVFIIINIVIAIKTKQHLFKGASRVDKKLNQYLYIVYRYGGMLYLKKENSGSKELYGGECTLFPKGCYFYDEALGKHLAKMHIDVRDYSYVGTARTNTKKQLVFYCFIVDVNDDINLNDFDKVTPFEVVKLDMSDLNKTLVMRTLIGEQFNIEL